MKSHTIKLIIFISTAALIGLIVTQTLWIKTAIDINKRQFEFRVQSAISNAVNEVKSGVDSVKVHSLERVYPEAVLHILKPKLLDSLLKKYLRFRKIDTGFEFALVKIKNDSMIFKTDHFTNMCSDHKIYYHCVSYIYLKENYMLELMFPKLDKYFMGQVGNWVFLSGIFLVSIILCFGFIVFAVFRQKKVSEMKTDFINNITHEFKTPISTISLASEILVNVKEEGHLEKVTRYAKIIQEENNRMQKQVDQVLRMSRIDKNEYEINKEETDIHELLHNAIHNLCLDLGDKAVNVKYILEAPKPSIMVDPIHLTNIVKNLVENACKYSTCDPYIKVSTSNTSEGIIISVEDNGIGIAQDKHKHIFEKFYRVPTGDVHDVKGSGIGLYYVKVMVEAHNGKVTVKSEPGKGSRFDVFLPFQ